MTQRRRVISLAPSATATLVAMGTGDQIVGVTAHCNLERAVVGGWLNPDIDRLESLDPDVVCTCDDLQADIRDDLRERGYDVVHTAPTTLSEVLKSFERLGRASGRPAASERLVTDVRRRLDRVASHVEGRGRPVVYCEEWSDPPMVAGNWVPDAIEAAGGSYPFVDAGGRSSEVSETTVVAADPDHVFLHICGHGERVDADTIERRGWPLDATVHVLDDDLLNQPSPRLVDGIETIAERLHGPIPTGR